MRVLTERKKDRKKEKRERYEGKRKSKWMCENPSFPFANVKKLMLMW